MGITQTIIDCHTNWQTYERWDAENNKKYAEKLKKWDYLGNGIIDKYLLTNDKKIFFEVNKDEVSIFPEYTFYKNKNLPPTDCYKNFYFETKIECHLCVVDVPI